MKNTLKSNHNYTLRWTLRISSVSFCESTRDYIKKLVIFFKLFFLKDIFLIYYLKKN